MTQRTLITIVLKSMLLVGTVSAQNYFTIHGYVHQKIGVQAIQDAQILENDSILDVTNDVGFFRITLAEGRHILNIRHFAYEQLTESILIDRDTDLYITLNPITLPEIQVKSSFLPPKSERGEESFTRRQLEKIPIVLGALDPVKALIHLPGISQGLEGTANIIVRGGEADQNLLLFDNLELYHKSHLFGFNSSLNGDMVDHMTVFKNYFPPKYGGRLSSILRGQSRTPDFTDKRSKLSIGLLNSSFYKNIPLKKSRNAIQIAGRTSYQGFILAPFLTSGDPSEDRSTSFYFAELTGKFTQKINDKSRLDLLFNLAFDHFGIETERKSVTNVDLESNGSRIGSSGFSIDYNSRLSENLDISSSLYLNYTRNKFLLLNSSRSNTSEESTNATDQTTLGIIGHKSFIQYETNSFRFEIGVQNEWINIRPQKINVEILSEGSRLEFNETPSLARTSSHSGFSEIEFSNHFLKLYGGVRSTFYTFQGFNASTLEPRVGLEIQDVVSLFYNRNVQFFHSVNSLNGLIPVDFLLPSTMSYRPQISSQLSAEVNLASPNQNWEYKFSPFYKRFRQLSQIRPGQAFLFNLYDDWREFLVSDGKGVAFGLEYSMEGMLGNMFSRVSYTFTRSRRTFKDVNLGRSFPSNFERPHDIKYQLDIPIGDKMSIFLNGQIASGLPVTIPTSLSPDFLGFISPQYREKNNFRLPTYHRLDILFTRNWVSKNKREKSLGLGMYNVYGRKNIVNVFYDIESLRGDQIRGRFDALYLLTFVPSLNYTVSW